MSLLTDVDTDGNGQIDYLEFINMMKNTLGLEIRPDNSGEAGTAQQQQ